MSTEATTNTLKNHLMTVLVNFIKHKEWTQKVTAEHLSVSQPRVSNLMSGKIEKFSTDMLLNMLQKVGYEIGVGFDESNVQNPLNISVKYESSSE